MASKLDTFSCHGLEFSTNGTQGKTACPFCADDGEHFFVNQKTGQWDCKRGCGNGNIYTFLNRFYDLCLSKTDSKSDLADSRGIPESALRDVAYNHLSGEWIIPVRNERGSITDLRRCNLKANKLKVISTTGCSTGLLFLDELKDKGPIFICEGEWDALALRWLLSRLQRNKSTHDVSVLAVPGANTFKTDWAKHFTGRYICLVYDNDSAGNDGMNKVQRLLSSSDVHRICWPSSTPDKYDVKDFIVFSAIKQKKPNQCWEDLCALIMAEGTKPIYEPSIQRTSFEEVLEDFSSSLHWNDHLENALALLFATMVGVHLPSDPIWLFLVGPPGAGKSLLLKALSDPNGKNSIYRDTLTTETLISGSSVPETDPSILPMLDGCSLIVKDYTAVLGLPQATQDYLNGVLRALYDGSFSRSYGNGVIREYNPHFNILAGVTGRIHGIKQAELGERFLKYEMIPANYDSDDHVQASMNGKSVGPQKEKILLDSAQAYLSTLNARLKAGTTKDDSMPIFPEVSTEMESRILGLSQLIAHLRATVSRNRDDLIYRPQAEIATRAAKQLKKLSRSLAFVFGTEVNWRVFRIVRQVAADTCVGWPLEVASVLRSRSKGCPAKKIENVLQISEGTVKRALQDMQMLGVVVKHEGVVKTGKRGRPVELWSLTPKMIRYWKMARFDGAERVQRFAPPNSKRRNRNGFSV